MKQETLEEVAERISPIQQIINFITENYEKENEPRQLNMMLLKKWIEVKLLDEESKWQQERSYSEGEVHNIIDNFYEWRFCGNKNIGYDEWFEQFKKK